MAHQLAHYDTYREELAKAYPGFGYALWEPGPGDGNPHVEVGDVGFIREGQFHRLFSVLLPENHESHERFGVPEGHEPLRLTVTNHINRRVLTPNTLRSHGVTVLSGGLEVLAATTTGSAQVSFSCTRKQGAVLSLPVTARCEDTLTPGHFRKWIIKHIDSWLAFTQMHGLELEMEDIVLVTGCHRTRSWSNIAFNEVQTDARLSLGVEVAGAFGASVNWRASSLRVQGAVLSQGPSGEDLPENQCIFIRGFRVKRFLGLFSRIEGAAEPKPDPRGNGRQLEKEVVSIPSVAEYRDPLHILLEYIAKRAPGCDMAVVHDDDLERILGVGDGNSLETLVETLQPDVVTDHLERSQLKIGVMFDSLPSGPSPTEHVRVAMLSKQVKSSNHLSLVLLLSRFVTSGFFPPSSQPPLQPTPWQTHLIGGDANTRPLRTASLGKWLASWSPFRYDIPPTMGQSSSPHRIPLALPTTSPPVWPLRTGSPQEWLRRDTLRPSFDYGVRSGSPLGRSSFPHPMPQLLQTRFGGSPNAAGQLQPRDRWGSLTGIDFGGSATSLTFAQASIPSEIDRALRCPHSRLWDARPATRLRVPAFALGARFEAADDGCYAYNPSRADWLPPLRLASSVSPSLHDDQQSQQQRRTEGMRDVAFGLETIHTASARGDTTTSGPLRLT